MTHPEGSRTTAEAIAERVIADTLASGGDIEVISAQLRAPKAMQEVESVLKGYTVANTGQVDTTVGEILDAHEATLEDIKAEDALAALRAMLDRYLAVSPEDQDEYGKRLELTYGRLNIPAEMTEAPEADVTETPETN